MMIRRLGSQILRVAIRRAGPELRGWGEAMLNEMDAIESDWAALRWAIGGAASLFRGFELPISDVSEVPERFERVQNALRRKYNIAYLACFLVMAGFSYYLVIFPNIGERVGCVLTILGAALLAVQLHSNDARRRRAASPGDGSAAMDRYRGALEHMRDFHRGRWLWSRMIAFLGPLLFAYAFHRTHPEPIGSFLAVIIGFLVLGIVAIPLNLNRSRKFQRELDRLDDLRKRL